MQMRMAGLVAATVLAMATSCTKQERGGATGQQAAGAGLGGDCRKHPLDGAELRLQAAADDGVHGIARLAAKNAIDERQLRGVARQRRPHQVVTRQDQPAAKHSGRI